jgi:hypothetical protein
MADATKAIHAARDANGHPSLPGTPVVDPIVQSANFTQSPSACWPGDSGIESLVCIPAETSHLTLTDDERLTLGILPGTLRFSFGLEDLATCWVTSPRPSPSYVSRGG